MRALGGCVRGRAASRAAVGAVYGPDTAMCLVGAYPAAILGPWIRPVRHPTKVMTEI